MEVCMKRKKYKSRFYVILIIFASIFMSIGYAAINSVTLNLSGSSNVLAPNTLFISDIVINENNSSGVVNLYDETFLDTSITLNDDESTVTLTITIKNNSSYNYNFEEVEYSFGPLTYDNENITFDLVGLSKGDVIESTESLTFDIIFHYADLTNMTSNVLNCKINFNFKNVSGLPLKQLILSNETEPTNNEDGLYLYQDFYYYSGENVNNYIWFNCQDGYNSGSEYCELWRILTVEADGSVKIIKNDPVEQQTISSIETETGFWYGQFHSQDQYKVKNMMAAGKVVFDSRRRRPVSQLTEGTSYCLYASNGCNAFSSNLTIGSYLNLIVDSDSSIKTYLNDIYYEYLLTDSAKDALQISEYNIGVVDINIGKDIDSIYAIERNIKCNSKVALLNISNYVLASKNVNCRKNFLGSDCVNDNWLNSDIQYMFLNGKITNTNAQIFIHDTNGLLTTRDANFETFLKPVVTLKPTKLAIGTGTIDGNYYKIVN